MASDLERDLRHFKRKAEEIQYGVETFAGLSDQLESARLELSAGGHNTSHLDELLSRVGLTVSRLTDDLVKCRDVLQSDYGDLLTGPSTIPSSILQTPAEVVQTAAEQMRSGEESRAELEEVESPREDGEEEEISRAALVRSFGLEYVRGPKIRLCGGGEVRLRVGHVISPDLFFSLFPLTEAAQIRFDRLQTELNRQCRRATVAPLDAQLLRLRPPCVVRWADDSWQRGRVASVVDVVSTVPDVKVLLEDRAKMITCRSDQICPLDPGFAAEFPRQSVSCRLWGIKAAGEGGWSRAAVDEFAEICRNTAEFTGVMLNESEPLQLILNCGEGGDTVNNLLVRMGFAQEC